MDIPIDVEGIRERVHRLIRDRDLACETADHALGERGHATRVCAACVKQISAGEVEYEVEIPGTDRKLFLHSVCHGIWLQECAALAADGGSAAADR